MSPLAVMQRSLDFRNNFPELSLGNISHVPRNLSDGIVFVEYSVSTEAAADSVMVTAANLGCRKKVTFNMQPLLANRKSSTSTSRWWLAFSTYPEHGQQWLSSRQVALEPCEVVVLMEHVSPKAEAPYTSRSFLQGPVSSKLRQQRTPIASQQLTISAAVFISVGLYLTFSCYHRASCGRMLFMMLPAVLQARVRLSQNGDEHCLRTGGTRNGYELVAPFAD